MTYFGMGGNSAQSFRRGLYLDNADDTSIAAEYGKFMASIQAPYFRMAYRIYVNGAFKGSKVFNSIASKYFKTQTKNMDYMQNKKYVTDLFNDWISAETNDRVKGVVTLDDVAGNPSIFLVNAIYFKGIWRRSFDIIKHQYFWLNANDKVSVDMMHSMPDRTLYGNWHDLDASGIQLEYADSDLSMLIILPKQREGLSSLAEKLGSIDLNSLTSRMSHARIDIYLPKFKIEFNIELSDVLSKVC